MHTTCSDVFHGSDIMLESLPIPDLITYLVKGIQNKYQTKVNFEDIKITQLRNAINEFIIEGAIRMPKKEKTRLEVNELIFHLPPPPPLPPFPPVPLPPLSIKLKII